LQRLNDLRGKFDSNNIDGLLVGSPVNRRYLSGFSGSAGWIVISAKEALLAVDFRYVEQAKKETKDFEVIYIRGEMAAWLPEIIGRLGIKKLGIEKEHTSLAAYETLCSVFQTNAPSIQPLKNIVESLRTMKSKEEIAHISRAAEIADKTMAYISSHLRIGISEIQFAWELENFIRDQKYEPLPFDTIVASGRNAALPHARPTDKLIATGEPVTVDLGARYNDYCSDITRTFVIGKGDTDFYKIYNVVLGAQLAALSIVEAGMKGADADGIARKMIDKAGYGAYFGHGLGHGIGLETHEAPRLGVSSDDILLENMVFTVEPGIYIPGWGGIRIEDTVCFKGGKIKSITNAGKEPHVLGG
jgi:Xaa-Pro aminopeptidase